MTTLATLAMLGGAAVGGFCIGVRVVLWVHHRENRLILKLYAMLEQERIKRRMAEHRLSVWIGLRETTVITVDRRLEGDD